MITSSDREYKATKRIKQGKAKLAPPFDELASWIGSKWHVAVLNVIYDRANKVHAPRLQVIVEHEADARKFCKGYNFDKRKQGAVTSKFLEIIGRKKSHGYNVSGLFVVFSAFAPLAEEDRGGVTMGRGVHVRCWRYGQGTQVFGERETDANIEVGLF